jgi:hypothetical protein
MFYEINKLIFTLLKINKQITIVIVENFTKN